MRSNLFLMAVVAFASVSPCFGQMQDPGVRAGLEAERLQRERERNERRMEAELEARRSRMRQLESGPRGGRRIGAARMSREDRAEWEKRVKAIRQVDPTDLDRHGDFLKKDKTGIFRLLPDHDCLKGGVIRVDNECSAFVPETSDYSFRLREYSDPLFHDISFNKNRIRSDSFFSHGILVSLGDVPIEQVVPGHAGLKFLTDFQPDPDPTAARKTAGRIAAGITSESYEYANSVPAAENVTYAIRVVAYKIGNPVPDYRRLDSPAEKNFFMSARDERDDIIAVFRVVRKDQDGALTIIWKELRRTDAPKIRFAKGEPLADFK